MKHFVQALPGGNAGSSGRQISIVQQSTLYSLFDWGAMQQHVTKEWVKWKTAACDQGFIDYSSNTVADYAMGMQFDNIIHLCIRYDTLALCS